MSWELALIKTALEELAKALTSLRKKGQARRQKTALSTVIAELLRIDPDITTAEARLMAAEATGAAPTPELLRARQMLDAAKAHGRQPRAKAGSKKGARRPATKKSHARGRPRTARKK